MMTSFKELFRTNAHVFQINPETKSSWLPKGNSAIPVAFVSNEPDDYPGSQLRIVGVNEDGARALDSTILSSTVFTKRSQKFGQWTDKAGIVWGLGFNSENELDDFILVFQKLQGDLVSPLSPSTVSQQQQQQQPVRNSAVRSPQQQESDQQPETITNGSRRGSSTSNNNKNGFSAQCSNTMPYAQQAAGRQQLGSFSEHDTNSNGAGANCGLVPRSLIGTNGITGENGADARVVSDTSLSTNERQPFEQIKYENERLKLALEESSKNAGVWQTELHNLRTNNNMLTQALQESKSHVEEWQEELSVLRKDNKELRLIIDSMDEEKSKDLSAELERYKEYVETLQKELKQKETDTKDLQNAMAKLEVNGHSTPEEQSIGLDQRQKFDSINSKLEAKLCELTNVQREFKQLLESLNQQ